MTLIDSSYFVGDIQLPNLDEIDNTFDDVIAKYEKEVLTKLLGYRLYNEFIAALGTETPDAKWIDLRDGATFQFDFCGNTIHREWNGLANEELISLIAYYVYYQYRNDTLGTTTSISDVIGIPENAEQINDSRKMTKAWNRGVNLYGLAPKSFDSHSTTYNHYNDIASAYNFLLANQDDYTNWEFTPIYRLNEFGI